MVTKKILSELMFSPKKAISSLKKLNFYEQSLILFKLSKPLQKKIMNNLKDKHLVNLINSIDSDDGTDLLQNLNTLKRKRIIKKLKKDKKEKIEFLLNFNPKTAAGIMNLDYIIINHNINFGIVSKKIKKHEKRTGKIPTILVVKDGILKGELLGSVLALRQKDEKIEKDVVKVPNIRYDQDENKVINIFKKNPHNKIVVLDINDNILGIIYSDDVLKLIGKKSLNTLTDFAGVSRQEDIFDSVLLKVKNRYPWLLIHLFTAFLAAFVISFFQDTISAFILLAVYMPIVATMGGNAGTQSMAVIVRDLAIKEINSKAARKVIFNEIFAGGLNGIINGLIVAAVAIFWNKSPLLGLVIGLAMVINLALAGFFGAVVPVILNKLDKDPASSAISFITAATDIFGFFIFLGLASLLI